MQVVTLRAEKAAWREAQGSCPPQPVGRDGRMAREASDLEAGAAEAARQALSATEAAHEEAKAAAARCSGADKEEATKLQKERVRLCSAMHRARHDAQHAALQEEARRPACFRGQGFCCAHC